MEFLFVLIEKLILKRKWKNSKNSQDSEMKNKVGLLSLQDNTYYKANIIKIE